MSGPPIHYCPDCDCYPCACRGEEYFDNEQQPDPVTRPKEDLEDLRAVHGTAIQSSRYDAVPGVWQDSEEGGDE